MIFNVPNRNLLLFMLLLQVLKSEAQYLPYFQQEVNYTIEASLDDQKHTLTGRITFEYVNNSLEELEVIWMHLWANAYKNRNTAFCRQKLRDGNARFYFAPERDLGYFKKLDFTVDGQAVKLEIDPQNPDIGRLILPKPLTLGARVTISTPFELHIPASFSRLGHVGQSYQMTQWYPKPAVYDKYGWHAFPYLDMGEFYSEFGRFDVQLTLPENYVVGATGMLETPSERTFLEEKTKETLSTRLKKAPLPEDSFPPSSARMKTIRYTAENVHDFAWFADKRFLVLRDTARLASGKTVDCWAMFTNTYTGKKPHSQAKLWEKGAFYVRRAVEFYSEKVGEYPWPHATAVHSALSAGGGMEYPMITVIGNADAPDDLDDVITHEVGHNWFYGILASNEREHPFLDEGINSYYEMQYMYRYYGKYSPVELPKSMYREEKDGPLLENGYLMLARDKKDTPPDTHSNLFSPIAYGLQVYMKTALFMRWLEQAVGQEKLDAAMQAYYREWQFKHPYPNDLAAALRNNGVAADWFFDAMRTQHQADYRIKKVAPAGKGLWEVTVQNRGPLNAPFPLTTLYNGKPTATRWVTPELGKNTVVQVAADSADAFEVDYGRQILDINRKNNFRRSSGLFPGMRPFEFRTLALLQRSRYNTIAVMPWLGWNNYDKTMLGILIYNPPVPSRRFQYYVLPGWSPLSNSMVGMADLRYKWYPGGFARKVTFGVGGRSFDVDYNPRHDYFTKMWRVVPQVALELRHPSLSLRQTIQFRSIFIGREAAQFTDDGVFTGKTWLHNTIHELRYMAQQKAFPHPWQLNVAVEQQSFWDAFVLPARYLRSTVEWKQRFYYQPKRKITLRCFAGYFLQNTLRNSSVDATALSLNPQGFNDYRYDELFLARSGADNILGRQVSQTDGGFKAAFGAPFAGVLGNSNSFVAALNLRADLPKRLPFGLPLKPYFDIGYFKDATPLGQDRPLKEQLLWSGGVALELFNGGLEMYFPLASSATLRDRYCEQSGGKNPSAIFCGGNYLKMISWSMRLRFRDPVELAESLAQ